jgi:hypothetical protein
MAEAEQSPCSASAISFCFHLLVSARRYRILGMDLFRSRLYRCPKDGGTGFYRFLVLDQAEAERCQV